jgi:3-isopropylmalate dehydratase small subunit
LAIKASGIRIVIAQSFARIFYRNAFNIGLPILESDDMADQITEGDRIAVDLNSGQIMEKQNGRRFQANPIPPFMMEIIKSGGLVNYVKNKGFA